MKRRCDARAVKGTGEGVCDNLLSAHGLCDRAGDHIDLDDDDAARLADARRVAARNAAALVRGAMRHRNGGT